MKKCEMCKLNEINGNRKFCEECRKVKATQSSTVYREQQKEKKAIKRRKQFQDNFLEVNPSGKELIPFNFDTLSDLSVASYRKHYKLNWVEILDTFNKKDELTAYIISEYQQYIKNFNSQSIIGFTKSIKSHANLLYELDTSYIREQVGIEKMRYEDADFLSNFNNVREKINKIPHYNEFLEHTTIKIGTYAERFNLKGKVYDQIVKMFVTKNEYEQYKDEQQSLKSQTGKDNHQGTKYSDDDLEIEFRRVYDEYLNINDKIPSRRTFNQLSNMDDSVYRHRFNISFNEVIEMYGYEIDNSHRTEHATLAIIDKILKEEHTSQKQFDWLLSTKNYPLRCDGYYQNYNLVIEYDGEQHSNVVEFWGGEEGIKSIQANDAIKNTLIPQHGIILIRIAYNDPYWDESFLRNKLIEHGIQLPSQQSA